MSEGVGLQAGSSRGEGNAAHSAPVLDVAGIDVSYGDLQVLRGVALQVRTGELVCVLGSNGAGKSTLLRTISGLLRPSRGSIEFFGLSTNALSVEDVVRKGIMYVPEETATFPFMSVIDNLMLGGYVLSARQDKDRQIEKALALFPRLADRRKQLAGSLSGGERRMLSIAMGLMPMPKLMMLDEPSSGLAPLVAQSVLETVKQLNGEGMAVLLVEQNVGYALSISDRAYVLENGAVVLDGPARSLLDNEAVRRAYLGL